MDALLAKLSEPGSTLWLLHVNADPDCVGSAFALREAFGGSIGASEGVSKAGRALAERLDAAIDEWPHPENHARVVAVDTSSRSQLGRLGARAGDPFLVDHHRYGDLLERAPAAAHDPARASCCEVALALIEASGRSPSKVAAFGLLVGLVTDSGRFRHADASALATAARLLDLSGATMEDAIGVVGSGDDEAGADDPSQRKATLLAATRAQVHVLGDALVAASEVSSFDAAAAGALVRCGADLALVVAERHDSARISMRASARLKGRAHLGEWANAAAREVGWSGGGHEGAAGLQGKPPAAAARDAVLRLARATLEAR